MKGFDRDRVGNLCRLLLTEQKAHYGKALFCAAVLIVLGMVTYVGNLKANCEFAVTWGLAFSILLPSVLVFSNFITNVRRGGKALLQSSSLLDEYLALWMTVLVNVFAWLLMVGGVIFVALWAVGNFFYGMPMGAFLEESVEQISLLSGIELAAMATVAVNWAMAWRIKGSERIWVPCVGLLALFAPLIILLGVLSGGDVVQQLVLLGGLYLLLCVANLFWGYRLFRKTMEVDQK